MGIFILMISLTMFAQSSDWVSLIENNTLDGWKPLGGEWTIQDGIIKGKLTKTPEEKDKQVNIWLLYTRKEFADFEFECEFRTQNPINGGIQFRTQWLPLLPVPENVPLEQVKYDCYGYQANIETRERFGTGRIIEENGRGLLAEPAREAVMTLKQRDWNRMKVVAIGPKIEVYLHDILAGTIEDDNYLKGYILLQVRADEVIPETAEIEYRNIRIKDLGRNGDWQCLFNGKDLSGWQNYGSEEWVVEDGTIVGKSGPKKSEGYLATEKRWKNFRIRAQFKMLGEGNYGLFYHSSIKMREDGYPLISGVQVEVEPGYPTKTGFLYESYKRGWLTEPHIKTPGAWALRKGDWNEIEVKMEGNRIISWLNGVKVVDFTDASPNLLEGFFALQLHTGGVAGIQWRELYVQGEPLP
ncbi:MAG: 3-keto-disaccharide hydrolase [Candidatus Hydrogenedens sp.]